MPFLRAYLPPVADWAPLLELSYAQQRFSNFGPAHERFCQACRRFAALGYEPVLVANATAGLTAVLTALNTQGAVVLPAFTFPATLHAVIAAGCEPILCDADPTTWEMDLTHLERLFSEYSVAAVMPVRSYGLIRDQSALLALTKANNAPVIFDSAAGFGHPDRLGSIGSANGEIEVFSLHATKVFAIGEGGLIFLPEAQAARLRATVNFGFLPDRRFEDGCNAKIDEIRAAIGLAMLDQIDGIILQRDQRARAYARLFARFEDRVTAAVAPGPTPWQSYPVRFQNGSLRDVVMRRLMAAGIETRPYYAPTIGSGYAGIRGPRFDPALTPVAERLSREVLCFPIYQSMTGDEQTYVFEQTLAAMEG